MCAKQNQNLGAKYFPEIQQLFTEFEAARTNTGSLPKAVVYGVYNSGKSSLLNSITGHIEQEYFATRDIPETKKIKRLKHQGVEYIDTPGLDVNQADSQEAQQGISQADLLLFVHKLTAGPIQASEFETMQQLIHSHGKPEQVFMVLTKAEQARQNVKLIGELDKQFKTLVPKSKLFLVSNTMFAKGVQEGKQGLIYASGITELIDELTSWRNKAASSLVQMRKNKTTLLRQTLLRQISAEKDSISQQLAQMNNLQVRLERQLLAQVQQLQLNNLQ